MDRAKFDRGVSKFIVYNATAWGLGLTCVAAIRGIRSAITTLDKYDMGGLKTKRVTIETDALYDKIFGKKK